MVGMNGWVPDLRCVVGVLVLRAFLSQVEEPAQSVVHHTLLEMLQSLGAPLYELIREHRPLTKPSRVGQCSGDGDSASTPPTSHVHSHFRLTQVRSSPHRWRLRELARCLVIYTRDV